MGNFEKAVVLLILLVCAIVLGISLQTPEEHVPTDDPNVSAVDPAAETLRDALAETQGAPEEVASAAPTLRDAVGGQGLDPREPRGSAPAEVLEPRLDPLLSALADVSDGREVALVTTDGLRKTVAPDYMIYTCREGDDWTAVSRRFYGDEAHAKLLEVANETIEELLAGDQILVPVYELDLAEARDEPVEPRKDPVFTEYVVKSGDSLSTISSALYGTGSRWMQIYDANRDVLDDPHSLEVGQTLRIP